MTMRYVVYRFVIMAVDIVYGDLNVNWFTASHHERAFLVAVSIHFIHSRYLYVM